MQTNHMRMMANQQTTDQHVTHEYPSQTVMAYNNNHIHLWEVNFNE